MNKIQAHPELQNVSLIGNSFFVDAIEINVMRSQTQRTDLWTWGDREKGESRMYGENNMETYTTIFKIDSQWEFEI